MNDVRSPKGGSPAGEPPFGLSGAAGARLDMTV